MPRANRYSLPGQIMNGVRPFIVDELINRPFAVDLLFFHGNKWAQITVFATIRNICDLSPVF